MSVSPDPMIANMEGVAAFPRKNGELVFDALWEGRTFGMAIALNEHGAYAWGEFRDQLIAEIKTAESKGAESSYYERFLAAFESLLISKGLISRSELEARVAEYESGERDDHDD